CCGGGGGGGGGRIAIQYKSFVSHSQLVTETNGGKSDEVDTGACGCSGNSTFPSLDAFGGDGRVTFAQVDASKLTIGASKTITLGTSVTISTHLTDAGTGAALGGKTVTLWKRSVSATTWTLIATKTTSATGGASLSVKPSGS